ncbi:MAG: hypothetical protein KGK14_09030, partial [Bacteroidota bacterium]|nr:hypothetical protein [Bacteroidota bacterium]
MKAIVILICFLFLQSCVEQQKPNLVNQSTIVLMPVHLMDTIQHFFNNDNWRVVMNGKDTFY